MNAQQIITNPTLKVAQKQEQLTAHFCEQPDLGVAEASAVLLETDNDIVAHFVAGYLSRVPFHLEEKRRALSKLIAASEEQARAASWLAQYADEAQVARMIERFVRAPSEDSPLYSVMYELALYFPASLRAHREALAFPELQRGMLSGAPDTWVEAYVTRYRAERDPETLAELGDFHTPRAARALLELRTEVPEDQVDEWRVGIEQAGVMADGETPSYLGSAQRALIADAGTTPHAMGGVVEGPVPRCPVCQTPASHVLTLRASALPFALPGRDPSFFWYACSCDRVHRATVRITERGREVLDGPSAQGSGTGVIPGQRSLVLEPHPNQQGVSLPAVSRSGLHQVGGIPRWISRRPLPSCPCCDKPMPVLASIGDGLCAFGRLGFVGILYGYFCQACSVCLTERR